MSQFPYLHCHVCPLAHQRLADSETASAAFECPVTKAAGRWDWPCAPTLRQITIVEVPHARAS